MLSLYQCLYEILDIGKDSELVDVIYNDLFFVPTDYYTNQDYYQQPMHPRCKCENTRKAALLLLLRITKHCESY